MKKPYRLHIVLKVAEHRFLTPQFQSQLQTELTQRLRRTFGTLVEIEVMRSHPLLGDIAARGLDGAIDAWDHVGDARTHFVLIGFEDGRYDVQVRFHDGPSGLASPFTRRVTTFDRGQIAGHVARLIEDAFPPTGTITKVGKEVEVHLQGGALADLSKRVQAGEVLGVSKFYREGGQVRARKVDWALLQVLDVPSAGVVRCLYHHRYAEDQLQEGGAVLGYRCLKLPARAQGNVHIRLVDDANGAPLAGWQVHVSHPANKKEKEMEQGTNRDGLAFFPQPLSYFARIKIVTGNTVRAQFPVPLLDDRPIVCRLKIDAAAEAQAPFELRRDQWLRRLFEELALAAERNGELQQKLNKSFQAALEHGRAGFERLQEEITYLTVERSELDRLADAKKIPRFDLADADQRLAELRGKKEELAGFIARVEKIMKEDGAADVGLKKWVELATLMEAQGDFDEAIRLYEKVVRANPDQQDVKARLEAMRKAWEVKSAPHKEARAFIYQSWPGLETAELKAALPQAEKALAACKDAGDKLTPRKLLLANAAHAAALKKRLDELRKKDSDDNRAQAKQIAETARSLGELHTRAAKWVGTAKKN